MKDLVTGATGFIGSHLVNSLVEEGRQVRALLRREGDSHALRSIGVEVVHGDITHPDSLPPALEGVDRVFHCAALVSDWGTWDDFRLTNVRGVENMLSAALVAGVRRFLHLSTTDVYGFPRRPGGEDQPYVYRGWPYGDTKIEGEKKVWQFHRNHGLPVTVIRPANVYGVGSRSFVLEIGQLLKQGDMIRLGRGRPSAGLCSVHNLVTCILLAARTENSVGQAYNVTEDSLLSWSEFTDLLAEKAGLPGPRVTLPRRVAYLAGSLMEKMGNPARSSGRPLLTRMAVELFTADQSFSIDKARRDLGYHPTGSAADSMGDMASWLEAEVT
jgi:nucleoside-diphosphate-sugar epimerase